MTEVNKKWRVWFQCLGRFSDSNNWGYAIIDADTKELAINYAHEDLTKHNFTDIKLTGADRNEEFDNEEAEEEGKYAYDVDWEAKGAHGMYYARSGPYAKNEREAKKLARWDVARKDGFMNFEAPLEADPE